MLSQAVRLTDRWLGGVGVCYRMEMSHATMSEIYLGLIACFVL